MNQAQLPDLHFTLSAYDHLMRADRFNVKALCEVGLALRRLNRPTESRKCYKTAVEALRHAIKIGDVEAALHFEQLIYYTFVSTVETEEHYYRCFSDWREDMARLGRRFREPPDPTSANLRSVGFILQTGAILGHTEVLFTMLEQYRPAAGSGISPKIYVLANCEERFLDRARRAGVEVALAEKQLPEGGSTPLLARWQWLRDRLRQDDCGIAVWVSIPAMASFALSMRLAPVQIFWALRFHPISAPFIDGYITWGAPSEKTRRYGNRDWDVVPMPLASDDSEPDPRQVANVRSRFAEEILLGTLARAEKIDSPAYLRAVAEVLAANPQAGFVWTGRSEHPGIAGFFRAAGVAERCHFVGWVDTKIYAAALDVFLETFPVGSGVTALQALGAGTPLLSYLHPETIFGTYFWPEAAGVEKSATDRSRQPALDAPDRYPILCARDATEYVSLANRLVSDAAWRREVGARGREFFLDEYRKTPTYAERFFKTIERIASAKLGRPPQ